MNDTDDNIGQEEEIPIKEKTTKKLKEHINIANMLSTRSNIGYRHYLDITPQKILEENRTK